MPEHGTARTGVRIGPPLHSAHWSAAWAVFAPLTLFLPTVAGARSSGSVLLGVLLLGGGSGLLLGILLGYLEAWALLGSAAGLSATLFLAEVLWLGGSADTGPPTSRGFVLGGLAWFLAAACTEVPLLVGLVLGWALRYSCEARWQRPPAARDATGTAGPGPGQRHRWTRPALWAAGSAVSMWLPWFFGVEDMAGASIMLTLLLLAVPAALLGWSVARHGEWLPLAVALVGGAVAMPLSLMPRSVGVAAGDKGPGTGEVFLELVLVAGLITGLPMAAGAVAGALVRRFRPKTP